MTRVDIKAYRRAVSLNGGIRGIAQPLRRLSDNQPSHMAGTILPGCEIAIVSVVWSTNDERGAGIVHRVMYLSVRKRTKSTVHNSSKYLLFPQRQRHKYFYIFGKGMPVYSSYPKARLRF